MQSVQLQFGGYTSFGVQIAGLGNWAALMKLAQFYPKAASEPADPVRYWQAIHPGINPVNREDGLKV